MIKPPDYQEWCQRELWEIKQGVQLLLRMAPLENPKTKLGYNAYGGGSSKLLDKYESLLETACSSAEVGTLTIWDTYADSNRLWERKRVLPVKFLRWAEGKGIPIPEELLHLLELDDQESEQQEPVEGSLDIRERTSLLKIIAVLAKEAGLDLEKHQAAALALQKMGAQHGMELPKSQNTIANKLRDAQDLLKSQ